MGKSAARKGDQHTCPKKTGKIPHHGGPIIEGEASVTINALPSARKGDKSLCAGTGEMDYIKEGSSSVFIGGKPAARRGDGTSHGGVITSGSGNVTIGNAGITPSRPTAKQSSTAESTNSLSSPRQNSKSNSNPSTRAPSNPLSSEQALPQDLQTIANSPNKPLLNAEKPDQETLVSIIPVRYAYDTEFRTDPPTELNSTSKLNGVLPKIVRQLRDGWVYVYDENKQELKEFEVSGATISNGGIQYPQYTVLRIAFSGFQWTERLKKEFSKSHQWRYLFMRRVNCRENTQPHVGPATILDSIPDMQPDCQPFDYTSTPLKRESEHKQLKAKPASSVGEWIANAPNDIKLVVRLDDPHGDILDLTLPIIETTSHFVDDEDLQHKLAMSHIVTSHAQVQIPEKDWPDGVDHENYPEFRADVHNYIALKHILTKTGTLGATATGQSFAKSMVTSSFDLKSKWGFVPDYHLEIDYERKVHLANEVDWDKLNKFNIEVESKLKRLDSLLNLQCRLLHSLVYSLGNNVLILGIDNQDEASMLHYLELCDTVVASIAAAREVSELCKQPVDALLEQQNLISTAIFGGDQNIANSVYDSFNTHPAFAPISRLSDCISSFSNYQQLIEIPEMKEKLWVQLLEQGSQKVFGTLANLVINKTTEAFDRILSTIAPHTPINGPASKRILLLSLYGTTVNRFTLEINKEYINASQDTRRAMREVIELEKKLYDKKVLMRGPYEQKYYEFFKKRGAFAAKLSKQNLIKIVNNDRADAFKDAIKNEVANYGKQAQAKVNNAFNAIGGFNAPIAGLNIANLLIAIDDLRMLPTQSSEFNKSMKEVAVTTLWTISAVSSVVESVAKNSLAKSSNKGLLELTVDKALENTKGKQSAQVFLLLRRAMAIASITGAIAAGIDAWKDFSRIKDGGYSSFMNVLLGIRGTAYALTSAAFTTGFIRILSGIAVSKVMLPWMAATFFWGGILIVVISTLITLLEKTPLEQWIYNCQWGNKPLNWRNQQEINELSKIIMMPHVEIRDVSKSILPSGRNYPMVNIVTNSYIVEVTTNHTSYPLSISVLNDAKSQTNLVHQTNNSDKETYKFEIVSNLDRVLIQIGYEERKGKTSNYYTVTLKSNKSTQTTHSTAPITDFNDLIIINQE
ncbi:PAAR domain-containing protein [Vibrio sp. SCSIO 43136]|uniref:PAAR domain-containing protein n=1 Tax=Vibrio sp. SCSIO 43136 TaxID=2819101 RepID=UPI002074B05C|nr:PAAR domain-containing protein [Vibrio sp. SCSIO 43136]USD67115.1 PAAR domain-containing protein [Vibrio sp. SCSIO 43136]